MNVSIRLAARGEAAALTALCMRSKAHWGYDDGFMELSREALTVTAERIDAGDVWVALQGGRIVGMVALAWIDEPDTIDLDKLFIEPDAIGTGIGRRLMHHAIAEAKRRNARRLAILADVHAADFYARMGARPLGNRASDAIPGRMLPYFEIAL